MSDARPPSPFRLQQAVGELRQACAALIEADPDLAEDDVRLADFLGSDPETCEAMDLLHRVAQAAVEAAAKAERAQRRKIELAARQSRFEHRAERLRDAVLAALQALDLRRVELADMTIGIRQLPPGVEVTDESALADRFFVVHRAVSKTAIKEAMEDGEVVDGAVWRNPRPGLSLRTR